MSFYTVDRYGNVHIARTYQGAMRKAREAESDGGIILELELLCYMMRAKKRLRKRKNIKK